MENIDVRLQIIPHPMMELVLHFQTLMRSLSMYSVSILHKNISRLYFWNFEGKMIIPTALIKPFLMLFVSWREIYDNINLALSIYISYPPGDCR